MILKKNNCLKAIKGRNGMQRGKGEEGKKAQQSVWEFSQALERRWLR